MVFWHICNVFIVFKKRCVSICLCERLSFVTVPITFCWFFQYIHIPVSKKRLKPVYSKKVRVLIFGLFYQIFFFFTFFTEIYRGKLRSFFLDLGNLETPRTICQYFSSGYFSCRLQSKIHFWSCIKTWTFYFHFSRCNELKRQIWALGQHNKDTHTHPYTHKWFYVCLHKGVYGVGVY